jgi:hypothetical protein
MAQWREVLTTMRMRRISSVIKKFEEGRDEELIRQRMIAIQRGT